MKATGIVRRIDDLGRIVIPKEIRRTLRIREGDPLEIYTDNNGEVIFKKYSPMGEMGNSAQQIAESIQKQNNCEVIVVDRDHCIACAGISKKEVIERRISQQCEDIMESRSGYSSKNGDKMMPIEGVDKLADVVSPIISAGDVAGAVIILSGTNGSFDESNVKLANAASFFLGLQMEE